MKNRCSYGIPLFLLMLLPGIILAQHADSSGGKTEIIQDQRVDLLVSKHIQIHQTLKTMDGYRIQLFSDSGNNSKTKAQAAHDEFQSKHPGVGTYLTFKSPNYQVRVGDFRTKLDAQRFLNEISAIYSNAFIITDQINLPKTD
ncbi:MAG: SPOR domain-containing protein [Bacteroidota bacterium]